jgi:hypothetical protein
VRNALTDAIVGYRLAELRMQRDVGILQVSDNGFSQEGDLASLTAKPTADAPLPEEPPGAQTHD